MESKTFEANHDLAIIVNSRKSAVILELATKESEEAYGFNFYFTKEVFKEFVDYIKRVSLVAWPSIVPREADSMGSDYYEYYDRELDNNGYLRILTNGLYLERPDNDYQRLYKFNKKKMESFLFDLEKEAEKTLGGHE